MPACPYGGQAGQHPTQLANPDLKWETTYGFGYRPEASISATGFLFEVDYYDKRTKIFTQQGNPGTAGFPFNPERREIKEQRDRIYPQYRERQEQEFLMDYQFQHQRNKNKITFLNGQILGTSAE